MLQALGQKRTTAELLSKTIGQTTLEYDTAGFSRCASTFQDANHSISIATHVAGRHLMTPDEIMRMF